MNGFCSFEKSAKEAEAKAKGVPVSAQGTKKPKLNLGWKRKETIGKNQRMASVRAKVVNMNEDQLKALKGLFWACRMAYNFVVASVRAHKGLAIDEIEWKKKFMESLEEGDKEKVLSYPQVPVERACQEAVAAYKTAEASVCAIRAKGGKASDPKHKFRSLRNSGSEVVSFPSTAFPKGKVTDFKQIGRNRAECSITFATRATRGQDKPLVEAGKFRLRGSLKDVLKIVALSDREANTTVKKTDNGGIDFEVTIRWDKTLGFYVGTSFFEDCKSRDLVTVLSVDLGLRSFISATNVSNGRCYELLINLHVRLGNRVKKTSQIQSLIEQVVKRKGELKGKEKEEKEEQGKGKKSTKKYKKEPTVAQKAKKAEKRKKRQAEKRKKRQAEKEKEEELVWPEPEENALNAAFRSASFLFFGKAEELKRKMSVEDMDRKKKKKWKKKIKRQLGRLRKQYRREWRRMSLWMKHMHYNAINFLVQEADVIICPALHTHNFVMKRQQDGKPRVFGKEMARAANLMSFAKFSERLRSVGRREGCLIIDDTGEPSTSKTCTLCGNLNQNLGGNKTFTCPKCEISLMRDLNGGYNNFKAAWAMAWWVQPDNPGL